ncbi:MAG: preprotein translocase subunit SecE [Planctomycetes bacterium]|nr:preprotein translocase subunit SecE [Planctomycetota bacterium]
MYKWPQGRIVRIVCLLLTALVTFDLAYNGAYGPLTAGEGTKQFVVGIVFCVLAFAALVSGLVAAGFHPKAVDFLIEVEQEMVRVEWPATNVLIRSTLIIAVAIVVMAVMILGVDLVNLQFLDLVRWLGGKL